MGKKTGFMEFTREVPFTEPANERIKYYKEFVKPFSTKKLVNQAARCMDCGVPFCHTGCPLGNIIPDFNDHAYNGRWQEALEVLLSTNNFPEFTGRLCPAPCEQACVLGIHEPPVTIELIEKEIIERGFKKGWIQAQPPEQRTGKRVAVVGSGPSGLACAQQLNRAGHSVTVYERGDRIGGLLRYGIPDFKLNKDVIDRRLEVMEKEGIVFKTSCAPGDDGDMSELDAYDAVALCMGSRVPRDNPLPGRDLEGVHFAMDFLTQQNRRVAGDAPDTHNLEPITATGKHVIVIGGGDTGSDCIGTSNRQGAKTVTNFEIMPLPPEERDESTPWPYWPLIRRTSSSHIEGCERYWSIMAKEFIGQHGKVQRLRTVNVEFVQGPGGRMHPREIGGTEYEWPADLVLLAMGFTGPDTTGPISGWNLKLDARGNIHTDENYQSSKPGVFAAGDARRGQSLIVWAISEGRECARSIDKHLMGYSDLPTKGGVDLPRA